MRRALVLAALLMAGCADVPLEGYRDTSVMIASSAAFDPARYAGRWYEIASYPTPFQRGCSETYATYTPREDGKLDVFNVCRRDGILTGIRGEAEVTGPGRLGVRLNGVPVTAPYWVLWVAEDYGTAVVGLPSGRAGWILSRERTISSDRLAAAREVLAFNGYDLARLVMTPQPGG